MTPKIERLKTKILALQAELVPLMDALDDELKTITAADILRAGVGATVSASQPKPRKPAAERKPRSEGLPARLMAEINASPSISFSADAVGLLKIDLEKVGQVRTTLSRLLKQGKIASNGVGIYCAKAAK